MPWAESERIPNMKFPLSSGQITLLMLMSDNLHRVFPTGKAHQASVSKTFYWGIIVVVRIDCLIFHMVELSLSSPVPWRLS